LAYQSSHVLPSRAVLVFTTQSGIGDSVILPTSRLAAVLESVSRMILQILITCQSNLWWKKTTILFSSGGAKRFSPWPQQEKENYFLTPRNFIHGPKVWYLLQLCYWSLEIRFCTANLMLCGRSATTICVDYRLKLFMCNRFNIQHC